jgi:transposase
LARVGIDYHVEIAAHFYRVPYRFARSEVAVRLTPRPVEIFLKGERIAAHRRSSGNHRHTTVPDHMPSSHRRYADWTVEPIRQEAAAIGPATAAPPLRPRRDRPRHCGPVRADPGAPAAPRTGVPLLPRHRAPGAPVRHRTGRGGSNPRPRDRHPDPRFREGRLYGSVRSILDNKLDRQAAQPRPADPVPGLHPNIRGPRYYH